jgi:hypothetical protein
MLNVTVTHMDTFAGEANGSWVRRYNFKAKPKITQRAAVLRAKRLTGLTNFRCQTVDCGSYITIRPVGRHELVTVDFD